MSPLPLELLRKPLREQVRLREVDGDSPIGARLAVLPALALAKQRELAHAWGLGGRMGQIAELRAIEFWRETWSLLRHHLESGNAGDAAALLDRAIERVEPREPREGPGA